MAEQPVKGKCRGRERFIVAAQGLVEQRPFDEITIDDIIKEAHLSRPAFYYHFSGGKEELRTELMHRGFLRDIQTQDTQQTIIEAAVRVFARSGVSAATLDDIASEAEVTKGALCWHFHSKDELLTAIVERYGPQSILRPVIDQIEQDLHNGVHIDDEELFRRFAGCFYDAFSSQGDFVRLAILLVYTHPNAACILADMIVKGRKRITEHVAKRQEEGHFRKDIDPSLFIHVMAMTFMMRAIGRGLNDLLPFSQYSREDYIEQLVSLLMYGMVRREPFTEHETKRH
ncbi:MAG TPA: TetR family transcriptional regulator [Ktedonobacteraceae bacterium]|nr:TetR family transcriptional regulator [Ktedonobacteraceae bacterium]